VDLSKPTMVLFGDAFGTGAVEPDARMTDPLDEPGNEEWLRHCLAPHGVVLEPAA
jgi:hypothetical protein